MTDHPQTTDTNLLSAWRSGDKLAGKELIDRYQPSIALFFARKQLGAAEEDLVQETFIALLKGDYRGQSSVRTYVFAIARNKLLYHLRSLARDRERFDASTTSIAALELSPSEVRVQREEDKLLLAALRCLPIDTQIMIELHYWEGMAYKDMSVVLGKPEGTLKSLVHRARKQLEAQMKQLASSTTQIETTLRGFSKWAAQLRAQQVSSHDRDNV